MNLNLFKEQTLQAILDETRKTTLATEKIAMAQQARTDMLFRAKVQTAPDVKTVDSLFVSWWNSQWIEGETTRNQLLERWFGNVLDDSRVHGVKMPMFSTSTAPAGELTDDSAGLICEPSTAAKAGRDDFAHLPQFWAVEVSAEKRPDGSHEIYAVEHIDDIAQVRSGEHLCWVLQKNTYTKEWQDEKYHYFKMQCHPAEGFTQWPQGTDRQGRTYAYMANPKYAAGMGKDGRITCGTGLHPVNFTSHSSGVPMWRKRGSQYAGASGCLLKFQLVMVWLKYGKKGNSGTIEGCTSYYNTAKAAATEAGATRVLLTESDGKKFLPGSAVSIGKGDSFWSGDTYCISKHARILSIETVNVEGTNYAAVNLDNGGATFDVAAGTTAIFTMPYWSGYNDNVLGYDGARTTPASGQEPGLIQKTEFQNGAYLIVADELWKWSQPGGPGTEFYFDCYTCHDQTKVSPDTITEAYKKQADITLVFQGGEKEGWRYVEDIAVAADKGVLWPKKVSTAAGSGTGVKAGFYAQPVSDGLRAAWFCCYLADGGYAGLAARVSDFAASPSTWDGCLGAPGLSG